ncbi:MAG: Na+/H+ antiporter subunit E [Coriobacteriia bacterium]|nr:Na+/H+ antiporter subunit E [Coriobacteriia bacterium]
MKALGAAAPLFVFWLVLTGSLAPADLALGLALSVLLGWWAARALWAAGDEPSLSLKQAVRFCGYLLWLIKEIVVAAVGVAEKVLDPRMPIEPVVVVHHSPLGRTVSRVVFANSITLTPGTLTVDVDESGYTVHCLSEEFATGIENGEMESRIRRVFEE